MQLGSRKCFKRYRAILVARSVRASHLGLLREPQVREVANAIVEMLASGPTPSEERSAASSDSAGAL